MKKAIFKFLATGFYSGYFPKAPGTAGSLLALVLAILCKNNFITRQWDGDFILLCILIALVGIPITGYAQERIFKRKDPKQVVLDEFAGMFIAVIPLGAMVTHTDLILYALAFVLFRFFDVLKPSPIRQTQDLAGGVGIVVDDVLAGIVAMLLVEGAKQYLV